MKTTKKTRSHGTIIQMDDMELGQFYAVHGYKYNAEQPVSIAGMAFKLTAMNLPFCIGKLVSDPSNPPLTFDARYLNFMKVTDEFVQAQRPETT
jgi:hypothetical protein